MMHPQMMNTPHGMPAMMNPNSMMESIKSMAITMAMVKSTSGSENSITNAIILMFVVSFIDTIINFIKQMIGYASNAVQSFIASKTQKITAITNNFVAQKKSNL